MNLEDSMSEFYSEFGEVLESNNMTEQIKKMKSHIHSKRKPLEEVQRRVKDSGFGINQIIYDKFYLRYADGTAMLNHFLIKIGFLEEWIKIVPEDKTEFIFHKLEEKLNVVSSKYGEFRLTIPYVTFDCIKQNT